MEGKKIIMLANNLKSGAKWDQFNKCNAYIGTTGNKNYTLIKSYNTVVGIVDHVNNKVYEFGKYSSTTSKQFTKIFNQYFYNYDRIFINQTNW